MPSNTGNEPLKGASTGCCRRAASNENKGIRRISFTETMLAGNWQTARMVAHCSAGAAADRGAFKKYLARTNALHACSNRRKVQARRTRGVGDKPSALAWVSILVLRDQFQILRASYI